MKIVNFCLISILALNVYAKPHPLPLEQMLGELLASAAQYSRYDMPDAAPLIKVMAAGDLNRMLGCINQTCMDNVGGYYNFTDRTIYVDERINLIEPYLAKGLLVHELIHFLQHHNGQALPKDCASKRKLEQEAFITQKKYLYDTGHLKSMGDIPNLNCTAEADSYS
jgi:hypothetical protein